MTMVKDSKTVDAIDASLRIEHLNTVLKALHKFREFASTEKSSALCLKGACNIFTEVPAYAGIWIISLGIKQSFERSYHAGHSSLIESLIKQFQENTLPSCYSKTLKEGNIVITDDLSATCPDDALSAYGSEMSALTCYLNHYNETFGIISVTLPRNLAHDNVEIELFKSVAEEITRQLCKQLQHSTCIRHGAKVRFESTLLGSVHQAVAATDLDGRILYWNGPAEKIFGWHEQEVLGERLIDLLSVRPVHEKIEELVDKIRKGWRWSGEASLKRRDGSFFPALVSTSPIYNDNGDTIGTVEIAIDLHPYKQAESKLLESETRFRTVFERSPVGIVLIGADLMFTKANKAFCEMTGYDEEELKDRSIKDITHPDDLEGDLSFKYRLLNNQFSTYRISKRLIRKNGTIAWVLLVSSVIKDANDNPLYLLSQVIDITEIKKTEDALRQSEAGFRELFERMTSAVMIFEVTGNGEDFLFKDINTIGECLVKNSKSDLLGKQILDAFPMAEKIGLLDALCEVNRTGKPKFLPLRHYTDQRLSQLLETNLYKLPSGEIVAVCDDRTDEQELEAQLLQSQKMDAVGQLAGGVAHDFNNQLTGILGYAELLKPKLTDQKQLHYLNEIIESGKRLSDLIKQLLAFSRKGQYQLTPVDLHKTIGEVVSLLQCSIDKRIQIRLKLNASLPITKGDPSQLHNAILNLAINARDAMH
ncbi:MAG: PAS domain S-box protein [Chlorobiales bacterium]|nr:PAS domain S-box protein [Chlorobiales bacterium]